MDWDPREWKSGPVSNADSIICEGDIEHLLGWHWAQILTRFAQKEVLAVKWRIKHFLGSQVLTLYVTKKGRLQICPQSRCFFHILYLVMGTYFLPTYFLPIFCFVYCLSQYKAADSFHTSGVHSWLEVSGSDCTRCLESYMLGNAGLKHVWTPSFLIYLIAHISYTTGFCFRGNSTCTKIAQPFFKNSG